jgi:hypothetical protein
MLWLSRFSSAPLAEICGVAVRFLASKVYVRW